ncbi:unnamed protein product [Closterium sp. NIES-65]|nr:unnamed protein product [Closterium sp. NIES-65]
MQPRGPRQVTASPPALPPLPSPVPQLSPPPIALLPPVKPPPRAPEPAPPSPCPINEQGVFHLLQFEARADGSTDNTDAFRRSLQTACAWGEARSAYARVVVPAGGLFQTFPVELKGPCGAGLEVQINGGIAGPANVTSYPKPQKSDANPGGAHLKVQNSDELLIEGITILSPFNSPNTDGIQLSKVENAIVRNSYLESGE